MSKRRYRITLQIETEDSVTATKMQRFFKKAGSELPEPNGVRVSVSTRDSRSEGWTTPGVLMERVMDE